LAGCSTGASESRRSAGRSTAGRSGNPDHARWARHATGRAATSPFSRLPRGRAGSPSWPARCARRIAPA